MKRVGSFTAKAGMLIRRSVTDVFEAFADPAITSNGSAEAAQGWSLARQFAGIGKCTASARKLMCWLSRPTSAFLFSGGLTDSLSR